MRAVAVFPEARNVAVVDKEPPRLAEPDDVMLRILDTI
jgi:threonine dehydrogenase-like Zn-dependent dehydrogenase